MEEKSQDYKTIDEYINLYPAEVQEKLQEIRRVIQKAAPDAVEKISWRMPTYDYHGNLVHFAAFKNHIGFYPGENGIAQFKDRFAEYKSSKGAVQFPLSKPVPYELISEIVHFRVEENKREAEIKAEKKKSK